MKEYLFLLKIVFLFQLINSTFSQKLTIEKIGGANFGHVHLTSYGEEYCLMDTSAFPYTDEIRFYSIGSNIIDTQEKLISMPNNVSSIINDTNEIYTTQSLLYRVKKDFFCLLSISPDGFVDLYDFRDMYSHRFPINYTFGTNDIVEFGNILQYNMEDELYLAFPTIRFNNYTKSYYFNLEAYNNFIDCYIQPSSPVYSFNLPCSKTKMISCFSTGEFYSYYTDEIISSKLVCFFKDTSYMLSIIIFNQTLYNESQIFLNQASEEEDLFYKGVRISNQTGAFAYYRSYKDQYLTISFKNITVDGIDMDDYFFEYNSTNSTINIKATNFNKNYMFNDLVAIDENTLYVAAASEDREDLYLIIINVGLYGIYYNEITIKLYNDYKVKLYKDLKITNFQHTPVFGFSHCNQKICEEKSYHSSSLVKFNYINSNYSFDLLKYLTDSNYFGNKSLIIDLNIYEDNIFGLKFSYLIFRNIPDGLILKSANKTMAYPDVVYDSSKYELNVSLNNSTNFTISYDLYLINDNQEGRRNLRRRLSTETKEITFTIEIKEPLSTSTCDELCALCSSTNSSICISCKYDYTMAGDKKICFNEKGEMNMSHVSDIYDSIKADMEQQDFKVIQGENAVFQFSTVDDQLNNASQDVSSVDLGDCEELLREQEDLEDGEQFIMIKMDIKNTDISATYVQYELYNPHTLEKVNMDVCDELNIKIYTPVSLTENKISQLSNLEDSGYNAFDIEDDFYNDICSTYTAENGADMALSSRKKYIYDENKDIYFCQTGCEIGKFDSKTSRAECNCAIQKEDTKTNINDLVFDKTKFVDSFYTTLFNSNFRVLKCANLLFSSEGMKSNYGVYMMSILIGLYLVFFVVHVYTAQKALMNILKDVLKAKGIEDIKDIDINPNLKEKKDVKQNDKNERKKEEKKEENVEEPIRKSGKKRTTKSKKHKHKKKEKTIDQPQAPGKRKSTKKHNHRKSLPDNNENNFVLNTNMEILKKNKESKPEEIKVTNKSHMDEKPLDEKEILTQYVNLNTEEINTLDYEIAIIIDKRSYCQYYIALIKKKNLLLFTFLPADDYNLMAIKILLFLVSFSLYFTINGFFFSDNTMNKIYEDNGAFNFIYQLPQIFYSSIISVAINMILKMLSLSEKQILELKKEKDKEKVKQKAKSIKTGLTIKLIIFLALSLILMLFFWYFISCFCAVYENTQSILIKDTLISFGLSMLYPFALNLLPGILRIPALRAPKKDQKYKYKISGYVALV